jgi:hypothetical protein
MSTAQIGAVVALAGRRIDAVDASTPSFPLTYRNMVAGAIHARLLEVNAATLVSSAACGADLLALDAAGVLDIRRRIVLPFDKNRFRAASVADRPGKWGELFDRVCAEAEAAGDLVVLGIDGSDADVYETTNTAILEQGEALATAGGLHRVAVVVWEGARHQGDDFTGQFLEEAIARGWRVLEVNTVPPL